MAARGGHLEVLQWAHANGCPWNEMTCAAAARGGHLEMLQWAHAKDCPWDEETCSRAVGGGYLEMLQWALANDCPWDEEICSRAARGRHLEVLLALIEAGVNVSIASVIRVRSVRYGHLSSASVYWATRLYWAAKGDHEAVVRTLIGAGADAKDRKSVV
jgi:hypothetical protein